MIPLLEGFPPRNRDIAMLDLLFLVAALVFFALTAAYADGCSRL